MKKEILKTLWGNYSKAAKALGITKGAVSQWKETLELDEQDRVRGAAVRTGVYKPDLFPSPTVSVKE
jgi:hypothetical protein